MKKLVLTSLALTCAASVFAQGTVNFGNRVTGSLVTYVYAPKPGDSAFSQIGNGATDTPVGAVDWTGFTRVSGSTFIAALMSAPGSGAADASLAFASTTTTFRTGTGAGVLVVPSTPVALANVAKDAPVATIQMFVWDNSTGLYGTAASAWTAWQGALIAGGVSGKFNVNQIGGDFNVTPNLTGLQSFNLHMVPEPSTMALAGLGAAALLIFRRRK